MERYCENFFDWLYSWKKIWMTYIFTLLIKLCGDMSEFIVFTDSVFYAIYYECNSNFCFSEQKYRSGIN